MIIYQIDGLGTTPIKEQALGAAEKRAAATGAAVLVTAVYPDGKHHSVKVHPDKRIEKLWEKKQA